eukprot:GFUD01014531.1.p1 GENE.GFUD01014531.1~~GFUD01014531.1.p1  ORF type:complete len:720 (+),score=230.78 GFUD01014531.1:162-2321(+)
MPPVHMFGRQWRISSDDFVCPALTELVVRVGWIVMVVFVIVFHLMEAANLECLGAEYHLTTYYLGITVGLLVITCCNSGLLAAHSARGKIFEQTSTPHPRRHVEKLLYLNIFLTCGEFIWTGIGTYFTINDFINCIDQTHERTVIVAVLVIIGLSYILLIIKLLIVAFSFRPYAKVKPEEQLELLGGEVRDKVTRQETELNYKGLRCMAPCTNDEDAIQAFRDIASLLSKIFVDKDLVPSDIVAGLVLLNHKHTRDKERVRVTQGGEVKGVVGTTLWDRMGVEVTRVVDTTDVSLKVVAESSRIQLDWEQIKHFHQFASAAYGYWWYIIQSPLGHCCSLGAYLNCCPALCCCRQKQEMMVEGDGFFHPNLAAIRCQLDVKEEDILMFDNRNRIEEVPFFLVADRSTKSLVVSIRGTLSLHDMLTDLRGEPGKMADESVKGVNVDWHGHQGMVNAARYVYRRLHGMETGRDGGKEGRCSRRDLLGLALATPDYAGYSIVVTGHSLGAGTAAILAFLLRARYRGTKVTCYAYSPPGGLISREAAVESEKFTVSVVVGDDVIPRTSLANIATLSRDIKHVTSQCQLPKFKILGYGCMAACCSTSNTPISGELDRLFPGSGVSSPGDSSTDGSHRELLIEEASSILPTNPDTLSSFPSMYLPGRILHVEDIHSANSFTVSEVHRTAFSEILVSPRMLSDHLPNHLDKVFQATPDTQHILPVTV